MQLSGNESTFDVDPKVPGLNPPVATQVKCFSLPLLPLGDQPLAKKGLVVKMKNALLPFTSLKPSLTRYSITTLFNSALGRW